jgi:hypothetical protein
VIICQELPQNASHGQTGKVKYFTQRVPTRAKGYGSTENQEREAASTVPLI